MFRGSEHYTGQQRDEILKKAGADSNAYTQDDRTVYHEVFSKDDFDRILELEADRFQGLKYDTAGYKTETKAVLGEFNKNSSDPEEKAYEVLRATAFKQHTYAHTTMQLSNDRVRLCFVRPAAGRELLRDQIRRALQKIQRRVVDRDAAQSHTIKHALEFMSNIAD